MGREMWSQVPSGNQYGMVKQQNWGIPGTTGAWGAPPVTGPAAAWHTTTAAPGLATAWGAVPNAQAWAGVPNHAALWGRAFGKGMGKKKKKGGLKPPMPPPKTKEEKLAEKLAALRPYATRIAPIVCKVIDEHGGFCYLQDVNLDPRVSAELKTIPDELAVAKKKNAKLIVEQFPDFFSIFN